MISYKPYYKRSINSDDVYQLICGLKIVHGPTGSGKTDAIPKLIEELPEEDPTKFMYVANRNQLLSELQEKLPEGSYVFLKRNSEILKSITWEYIFGNQRLAKIISNYVAYLKKLNTNFKSLSNLKKDYEKLINDSISQEETHSISSQIMNYFKKIILAALKISLLKDKDIPEDLSKNDYNYLINSPEIRKLFPYIEYKYNPKKKILLLTIQKFFLGFFDGEKNINIFNLTKDNNEGNKVIFLDELDFLANDLLDLLCKEVAILSPFEFVEMFYSRMKEQKLPHKLYLDTPLPISDIPIRDVVTNIVNYLDNLQIRENINFPEIYHFICTQDRRIQNEIELLEEQKKSAKRNQKKEFTEKIEKLQQMKIRSKSIFPTGNMMFSQIYLSLNKDREGTFDLVKHQTNMNAVTLFNTVNKTIFDIVALFKDVQNLDNPKLYSEFESHCFRTHDTFKDTVRKIGLFPRKRKLLNAYDFLQYNGFTLYEIQDLQQDLDEDEVGFNYFTLYSTPERILLTLAQNNLVFGLSATAIIPRLIKNFDLNWIAKVLKDSFFHVTKEDKKNINQLNTKKHKKRQNKIIFSTALLLDEKEQIQKNYYDFLIKRLPYINDELDNKYRVNRVSYFLSTLFWIINKRTKKELETDTHLIFLSTFKHIKYLFDSRLENEELNYKVIKPEKQNNIFMNYHLFIENVEFIVVFYDSNLAQNIKINNEIQNSFNKLFWQRKPVILVTQYASAGNGVNLQYLPKKNSKELKDFKNIHLLDCPYFYFGPIDEDKPVNEKNAVIRMNIYHLLKLTNSKLISTELFNIFLSKIRHIDEYNRNYLKSEDGILNQLSVFIQALGRIERVWSKMEDQTIRLSIEVRNIFEEVFCHPEKYGGITSEIDPFLSSNIKNLINLIQVDYEERGYEIRELKEDINDINQQNKELIDRLLKQIQLVRAGEITQEKAKEIIKKWVMLRKDALKHNFTSELLKEYNCLFSTSYYHQGNLYINKRNQIVPYEQKIGSYNTWDLDSIYKKIISNEVIFKYFRKHGYELSFNNHRVFFTPFFYQAVLVGAIGEESIKAIFENLKIPVTDEIDSKLFELADAKIIGKPWYLDFKHYSENTLQNFSLKEGDPLYHSKLNDTYFKESARKKLLQIQQFHKNQKEDCKLIYINFIGKNERIKKYWDIDFKNDNINFNDSKIITIQGVIETGKKNNNIYCKGIEDLVNDIRMELGNDT